MRSLRPLRSLRSLRSSATSATPLTPASVLLAQRPACDPDSALALPGRQHDHGKERPQGAALFGFVGAAGAVALALLQPPVQCYFEENPDGSTDRIKRWATRSWAIPAGQAPRFHLKAVNPMLEKHLARWSKGMSPAEEGSALSVLVPLCGKTFDMPFLCENGYGVVGVEGVPRAIMEFRAEHRMRVKGFKSRDILSPGEKGSWEKGVSFGPSDQFAGSRFGQVFKKGEQGIGYYRDKPAVWSGKVNAGKKSLPLHVIEGDMFDVTPQMISAATFVKDGRFDLAFDRGSLVAIPPESREQYVSTLSQLIRPGGRILLVALDYDQEKVPYNSKRNAPPPFSVTGEHVRALFPAGSWCVEVLEDHVEDMSSQPAFKDVKVREVVYLIEKRGRGGSGGPTASSGQGGIPPCVLWLGGAVAVLGGAAAWIFAGSRQ
mmetsp:Transcript_54746/g.98629  ORF Transcript_54746/g.98629 Transcript_54746/m.98629 type:complete len:432 (-) Transcript_54746:99-1394(-)